MVKINLIPDVKREYLHAQQTKHAVIVSAILISIASFTLLAFLYAYVQFIQPRHRANVQTDIDRSMEEVKQVPDAAKMATVQGALEQLPGLQDKKQITSRLFDYIKSFTPRSVAYGEIKLDLASNTMTVRGETKDYEQNNVLANNLKSAELSYTQNDQQNKVKPFSKVVFSNLGRSESSGGSQVVSFQIDVVVDPILFNESISNIKMSTNAASSELLIPGAKPFKAQETKKETP